MNRKPIYPGEISNIEWTNNGTSNYYQHVCTFKCSLSGQTFVKTFWSLEPDSEAAFSKCIGILGHEIVECQPTGIFLDRSLYVVENDTIPAV